MFEFLFLSTNWTMRVNHKGAFIQIENKNNKFQIKVGSAASKIDGLLVGDRILKVCKG